MTLYCFHIALRHLFLTTTMFSLKRVKVKEDAIKIIHLYLKFIAKTWKEDGYQEAKNFIRSAQFSEVVDWYINHGINTGFLIRNATWASLVRQSDRWHDEVQMTKFAQNRTWLSLIVESEIDGIKIKALTSSFELAKEGRQMKHCISSFEETCARGEYLVFSFTEPNQTRSTLGVTLAGKVATIQQHRSVCNGKISPVAERTGELLVKHYNKLLKSTVA